MAAVPDPRHVAIVVYPGVQSLDVTGPLEVFAGADAAISARRRPAGGPPARGYEVSTVGRGGPTRSSSGLAIVPERELEDVQRPLDTLIVPGGSGHRRAEADERLVEWIARTSTSARRTVSVCTGAFLLARAGLLEGRRATTHWASAERLAAEHPGVEVDPDPIYIRDGAVWTSAGVTAGMDLALALVEEDHDRELALTIARHLVLFLRRPGSQSQFSATLTSQEPEREPLREIQRSVIEDPAGEHTVEAMAARAHMSPRHFARAFRAETGVTPGRYVERVRLEAARRLLEDTSAAITAVAAGAGFPSAETMRRAFIRALGVSPAEYKRRFHGGPRLARARTAPVPPRKGQNRKDEAHGHRDRAVRQVHGARRGRAV
ncbi:MAG TPA: GlxA family transcriptional regulator [Solirubrobacteraceae bacterium]|nr:GlxA family transcriptional regulator [Solirubrobacteraceae bacterium]